jgi:AcrR family transcriptional regulator
MPTPARQRILDAALSLIQRRGIELVTTREIAMVAGAAEGSLFKKFRGQNGAAHRAAELRAAREPRIAVRRHRGTTRPRGPGRWPGSVHGAGD